MFDVLLFVFTFVTSEPTMGRQDRDYLQLRYMAFAYYADQKWIESAEHFTLAVDDYWTRRQHLSTCITECTESSISRSDSMVMLGLYIKAQESIDSCMMSAVGPPLVPESTVEEIMRKNEYYSLIQDTFYRAGNITGSVEAAQTFLIHNPSNVGMYQRLISLIPELDGDVMVTSRRDPLYHTLFVKGVQYYDLAQWGPCLHDLQQSISLYLNTVDMCRLHCTYEYDRANSTGEITTYINTMKEMMFIVAQCRAHCYEDLEKQSLSDAPYLASMLEYWQFCQYQMNDVQGAADSTRSYQILHTRNSMMNSNVKIYEDIHGIVGTPRPEIVKFIQNYRDDLKLNIHKNMRDKETGQQTVLFQTDDFYASEKLIEHKACRTLINLAKEAATANDGYAHDGDTSPFTKHETFSGIELSEAVKKLEEDLVDLYDVQTFIDVCNELRFDMILRMKLVRPLYFNYIHLVKRDAIETLDIKDKSDLLSHPLHGDNCVIKSDGSCIKEYPAYTYRDWSGLIYLNTPKRGGEFIITNADKSVKESVSPKCGTVVGFTGGTIHGVKQLHKGERFAIALWFTHDISKAIDMDSLQRRVDKVLERENEA